MSACPRPIGPLTKPLMARPRWQPPLAPTRTDRTSVLLRWMSRGANILGISRGHRSALLEIESTASTPQARGFVNDRVTVVGYDPAWPAQAEEETTQLRAALGQRVREIENIASTAVPGLAAADYRPASRHRKADLSPVADAHSGSGLIRGLRRSWRARRRSYRRRQLPVAANLHIVWNRLNSGEPDAV